MKKHRYHIGIDTGDNTGLCIWDAIEKKIVCLETWPIHKAMEAVRQYAEYGRYGSVTVRVEDARQRKWFGNTGREKLQGVGSVKRDASIWEDFLKDLGIDFEMVAPKNNMTKTTADYFKRVTGYTGRTSQHARDAAMLVFSR